MQVLFVTQRMGDDELEGGELLEEGELPPGSPKQVEQGVWFCLQITTGWTTPLAHGTRTHSLCIMLVLPS